MLQGLEVLHHRQHEILIMLRVFHSAPAPTTVRINIDGNAPIDRTPYETHGLGPGRTVRPQYPQRMCQTSRVRRPTVPGGPPNPATRARRVRAGGEEVEAPPHSVASAPRVAPYDLTRLGRMRPGAVRSTRGDSGRPPGSPRTAPLVPPSTRGAGLYPRQRIEECRSTDAPILRQVLPERATCMTVPKQ